MPASQSGKRPIGVFDSGMGGFSVLRAMRDAMPTESVIYIGDTAHVPYGPKSTDTVTFYSKNAVANLVASGVKAIVIACNTATVAALEELRVNYPDIPIIGVVEPGARSAATLTRNGRVAVVATVGTIKSGAHARMINEMRPGTEVIGIPAPLFVSLAEEGWLEGPAPDAVAVHYLTPAFDVLPEKRPDCLLVGCTHIPFFSKAISKAVGADVTLIDPAIQTVRELQKILEEKGLADKKGNAVYEYRASSDSAHFAKVGSLLLKTTITPAEVRLTELGTL